MRGPVFNIDEPLRPGDTDVSGVGPAGMDIVVVNASLMSQEIGKGTVGQDGKFDIEVSPPLLAGHRIGIVSQTTLSQEEVERVGGDGMRFLGRGGWLLESALVEDE